MRGLIGLFLALRMSLTMMVQQTLPQAPAHGHADTPRAN